MSFNGNQYSSAADKVITTRGDIVRGDASGDRERLGLGTTNYVLKSDGSDVVWGAASHDALTDTYVFVGNVSNQPVGVVISGDATLANTGALTLDADVNVKGIHDMAVPASAMWTTTTNGAEYVTVEIAADQPTTQTFDFDQSTEEHVQVCLPMPRNFNNGTITASFYWSAASSSGDVVWSIAAGAYSNDDPLATAFGTEQTVTDTLTATNDVCISSFTTAVTIAGTPQDSDLIWFQVNRNAADGADTLDADAKLLSIVFTYTLDSAVAA